MENGTYLPDTSLNRYPPTCSWNSTSNRG